jgi:nascent polypeptide-associated complex subunit beta
MSSTSRLQKVRRLSRLCLTDRAVHSAISSNLFAIYGNAEEKELTELVPGILSQLGPDSLASLRKLAESYKIKGGDGAEGREDDEDDDDIPDLVTGETFESKAAEVE